jgi:glycosyltransferase involved in cell wall biosynthesis
MKGPSGRLIICGPLSSDQGVGGLQAVLSDLAHGLQARDWVVDTFVVPAFSPAAIPVWRPGLAAVSRAIGLPDPWRFLGRVLLNDLRGRREASHLLETLERRVLEGGYDAVLACVDNAPVGLAALLTRIHPRVVLINLAALAFELRDRRALELTRDLVHWLTSARLHQDVLRPADPTLVSNAVFASHTWRDHGVAAGLGEAAASVIHFGIRSPAVLPPVRSVGTPVRLLWAARLATEKGLHLYLPALAQVRERLAFRLTVLDAGGPAAYRRSILRMIDTLGLDDVVDRRPAVSRDDLPAMMTSHDVFLFHSVYTEPVAQMLLLAFANGIPVVGPRSRNSRSLLQPGETAFCYDNERPEMIAAAVDRASRDETTRRRLRTRAFAVVAADHLLARTVDDYDRLLTRLCPGPRTAVRA